MRRMLTVTIAMLVVAAARAADGPAEWQGQTVGPRMQVRGKGAPPWLKGRIAEFDPIAGSLGFQVYLQDGKLRLNQFTMTGYGAIVTAQERFLSQSGGYYFHYKLIPVGAISGDAKGSLLEGPRDWARGEYGLGEESFRVCVSCLCPGLLLRSKSRAFTLFEGIAPPPYYAYAAGDKVQVRKADGAGPLALDGMSEPWLLCWFGDASTIKSCSLPQPPYNWGTPDDRHRNLWHGADLPVLLVFQSVPAAVTREVKQLHIEPAASGIGDDWAAKLIVLPLFGNLLPKQTATAQWTAGLPAGVVQQCRWWSAHLDQYPLTVKESYAMQKGDPVITEEFSYEPFRKGKTGSYAPVPPMLAIATSQGFPVEFSPSPMDTGVKTSWGPCQAIEGTTRYTATFKALMKYVDESPVLDNGTVPAALQKRFEELVAEVVRAGHLAPYIPMFAEACGWLFTPSPEWSAPADALLHMSSYLPLLPEASRREALAWMRSEREQFPPERVGQLDYASGARRELYPIDNPAYLAQQKRGASGVAGQNIHVLHKILPLENVTGLAIWCEAAGGNDVPDWTAVQGILDPYLKRLDWASLGYVSWGINADGYVHGQGGVMDINRLFIALRAAARLANRAGNTEAETMCRALFCKTAALRFCMAGKYANYLYDSGLKELPKDPAYLLSYGNGLPYARALNLYTADWKSRADDVQQIAAMDEFGTFFHETAGTFDRNSLAPFRPMSPELGRFLGDFLKEDCAQYVGRVEYFAPDWYCRYSLTCLGSEGYALPFDTGWQTILAKAWILGEKGEALEKYLDMPWLKRGDFFYMDKLAATVMAYRGFTWKSRSPDGRHTRHSKVAVRP